MPSGCLPAPLSSLVAGALSCAAPRGSPNCCLTNLGLEDYRNLLHMLQTEKPVFRDSEAGWLRTAHPQMHDAEPVGDQEVH